MPAPGPAISRTDPSVVSTACRCASSSPARRAGRGRDPVVTIRADVLPCRNSTKQQQPVRSRREQRPGRERAAMYGARFNSGTRSQPFWEPADGGCGPAFPTTWRRTISGCCPPAGHGPGTPNPPDRRGRGESNDADVSEHLGVHWLGILTAALPGRRQRQGRQAPAKLAPLENVKKVSTRSADSRALAPLALFEDVVLVTPLQMVRISESCVRPSRGASCALGSWPVRS